ncbi:MAG: J domain-containing protein [Gloeomargarita sp. SKYG116]|nr:J domain-containing protein [Gloeomargarita sp. SKYG116]MDW8400574.1 J domain-containing protein [Gloeomargarita sp. SKYGB_i_bin116]
MRTGSTMRNFRNYYQILGVDRNASLAEIKRAYRQLARRYHPDLNPGNKEAEEMFKIIGEAYQVLSDSEKRAEYNRFGQYWQQKGFQGEPPPQGSSVFDYGRFADFQDFLDQLLTRFTRRSESPPPQDWDEDGPADIEARLQLSLQQAYRGGRQRLSIGGRTLEVNLPPGMVTGQRIRLRHQGENGGDLYLKIYVLPDEHLRLEGDDIYCTVPVTPSEAILGAQVPVPTLDGPVKLSIPPRVQNHQRLRLTGRGYPREDGTRGDQIVEVVIQIPTELSPQELQLYEQIRKIERFDPRQPFVPDKRHKT